MVKCLQKTALISHQPAAKVILTFHYEPLENYPAMLFVIKVSQTLFITTCFSAKVHIRENFLSLEDYLEFSENRRKKPEIDPHLIMEMEYILVD